MYYVEASCKYVVNSGSNAHTRYCYVYLAVGLKMACLCVCEYIYVCVCVCVCVCKERRDQCATIASFTSADEKQDGH